MNADTEMEQEGRGVLRRLVAAGYEAYFVGGCVRDKLLGRPLKDIDIATSALPEQVMDLFPRTAPTGLKHGTVTVIAGRHTFEVTTFRKESEYEQFRRPKHVEFIPDLIEDLRRRDFTINAMALDADGHCIDPFGGQSDLAAGCIRCVGDPMARFHEDALRMLRGIRFACEYGFEPEAGTWQALVRHAPLLVHVAMERVHAELEKMIEGRDPDRAVRLLMESGLTRHFKQPVAWPLAGKDGALLAEPIARRALSRIEGATLRWAALFVLLGMEAAQARQAMKALKFAGKKSDAIVKLLQADAWVKERLDTGFDGEAAAEGCVAFGQDVMRLWLDLAAWQRDELGEERLTDMLSHGRTWIGQVPVSRVADLAVTGTQLVDALGMPAGPWLGELLRELLIETAKRRIPNESEALIAEAKKRAKREST